MSKTPEQICRDASTRFFMDRSDNTSRALDQLSALILAASAEINAGVVAEAELERAKAIRCAVGLALADSENDLIKLREQRDETETEYLKAKDENAALRLQLAKAGVGDYKADYFLGVPTETGLLRTRLTLAEGLAEALEKDKSHNLYLSDRTTEALARWNAAKEPNATGLSAEDERSLKVFADMVPTIHRISPEDPPQFPCWLWCPKENVWSHATHEKAEIAKKFTAGWWPFTHWHPDQPTAPTQAPHN